MSYVRSIRWKPVSLLASFMLVVFMPLTVFVHVSALASCNWINDTSLTCAGITWSNGTVSGNSITFSQSAGQNCPDDTLTLGSSGTNYKDATSGNVTTYTNEGTLHAGYCSQPNTSSFTLTSSLTQNSEAGNCNTSTDASGQCQSSDPDSLNCTAGGGFLTMVVNWILCAAINLAWGAANILDNWIMNELDVDATAIFDNTATKNTPSNGYYTAWNSFRILATALLVIAGLVMVIAQAIGFEALDAYTIRKVLPRLIIAIIGISLSWPLMRLVVLFFDAAGLDIREIMYAPFQHLGGTVSAGVGLLSYLGIGATLFIMGPVSLTFLLTAMLAAFVGFLVLVIRQIAIVMLVILAPIAIACYILPNTQKIWKLWYDNFLGLMLMFPIISALIAAGHIFAAVTDAGGPGGGVVAQAVGLMAYFAPYFMIPFAARMATGVIGNIAGFVNDRHKGAFDRLKGARGNMTNKNLGKMKAGTRFSERNRLTRGLNRTTGGVGLGLKGHFGMGERGRTGRDSTLRSVATNDVMKNPKWIAQSENDDVLRALTYRNARDARRGMTARGGMSPEEIETAIAGAQNIGFGSAEAIASAQQLSTTGTGYRNLQDEAETIARASGGNRNTVAAIAGYNNYINKQKGRFGLSPGAGALATLSNNILDDNAAANSYAASTVQASRVGDPVSQMRGKRQDLVNQADALVPHLHNSYAAATALPVGSVARRDAMQEVLRTASQIKQLSEARNYGSPENQQVVKQLLDDTYADRTAIGLEVAPAMPGAPARPNQIDPVTGMTIPGTPAVAPTAAGPYRADWENITPPQRNMNDPNLP